MSCWSVRFCDAEFERVDAPLWRLKALSFSGPMLESFYDKLSDTLFKSEFSLYKSELASSHGFHWVCKQAEEVSAFPRVVWSPQML